jgi:hypothetical protein
LARKHRGDNDGMQSLSPDMQRLGRTVLNAIGLLVTWFVHTEYAKAHLSSDVIQLAGEFASLVLGSQLFKRLGDVPASTHELAVFKASLMPPELPLPVQQTVKFEPYEPTLRPPANPDR